MIVLITLLFIIRYSKNGKIEGYFDTHWHDYYSITEDGDYLNVICSGPDHISGEPDLELDSLLWITKGNYARKDITRLQTRYKIDNSMIQSRYDDNGAIDFQFHYNDQGYLIQHLSVGRDEDWKYTYTWEDGDLVHVDARTSSQSVTKNASVSEFGIYIRPSSITNKYSIDVTSFILDRILLLDYFYPWSDDLNIFGYYGKHSKHLPAEIIDGIADKKYTFNYEESKQGISVKVNAKSPMEEYEGGFFISLDN